MGKHRHQPSPSSSSSSDEANSSISSNKSISSIEEQRKKKSVNTKQKHKESQKEKSSRKREINEEFDRKRSKENDDGKGRSKTHSSSRDRKESTSTNKGSSKKLEDIQSTSRIEDYDKYKERSKKDSSRSHKQQRSLSKEKMEKSLNYDSFEERKKQSKKNKTSEDHLEHSRKEVSSKEKTSKGSKLVDNLKSKEEYIDFDNDHKYEDKKQKRKKSESSADENFSKKLKKHEEKHSEDKMKESHKGSDSKKYKNKDKENYKEDEVLKSSKKEKSSDTKSKERKVSEERDAKLHKIHKRSLSPKEAKKEKSSDTKSKERKVSEERDVKLHKIHKRSLSPKEDVSECSKPKKKDGKSSKKDYKSIDADADLDELQMMKEQLQQQLDQEERKERRSSRHDEHYFEKDYRREEEERRFFNKDRTDSHKNLDSYKDKRSSRHEEDRRSSRHEEQHVLTESPSSKSCKMKTSDTYWNKYADKLGIKIHDPEESSRQSKRSGSPQSCGRKVTSYEDIDNFSKDKKVKENENTEKVVKIPEKVVTKPAIKKPVLDPLSTRTGGAYIPPAKLKMMQDQMTDKSSAAFQRLSWEALKKSLNGLVNKVNVSNIGIIVRELFKENIVRGRGLLCRALMQAQSFSPTFTHVYAAMAAVINTKFPQIGELLLHRLILQLRRGVKRNDKNSCMASCRFVGHLVNQQVAHEVVALEILTMLLDKAKDSTSDDSEVALKARHASVELAIAFMKECGMRLTELTPKGVIIIMETLRNILHEGQLEARFKYMIEVLMAVQKENFKDFPAVQEDLDLVEEDSQFTHMVELDGSLETGDMLNVFRLDPDFEANEEKYRQLRSSILADDSDADASGSDSGESGTDSSGEENEENATKDADGGAILDRTEMNLVAFRRIVYLTIQSSLDVDECAHKLLKGEIKPGWEEELCNMIIDCCAQQRTYIKFYGLLAQRFCQLNRSYQNAFETIFADAFETCHRLEIEKLRNVAKLFAHLMFSDAVGWTVMTSVRLNQDETTSSSRVFLKILFEELANDLGLQKLSARLREPTLSIAFEGLLPRDNPIHTRFAINFFTTIGLGGLTDDLREFLRTQPKPTAVVAPVPQEAQDALSTTSSDSSNSSSSSDSDSSSSDSSDSDSSSSSSDSSPDNEDKGSSRRSHNKRRKKVELKNREESEEELVVEKSHKRKKNIEERRNREEKNRDDFRDNRRKDTREEEREQRPRDGKKEHINKRKQSNERESFRPREDYRDQRYLEERENRRDERSWKSGREEKSRREEREERPRERKEHRSRDRSYEHRKNTRSIKGRP